MTSSRSTSTRHDSLTRADEPYDSPILAAVSGAVTPATLLLREAHYRLDIECCETTQRYWHTPSTRSLRCLSFVALSACTGFVEDSYGSSCIQFVDDVVESGGMDLCVADVQMFSYADVGHAVDVLDPKWRRTVSMHGSGGLYLVWCELCEEYSREAVACEAEGVAAGLAEAMRLISETASSSMSPTFVPNIIVVGHEASIGDVEVSRMTSTTVASSPNGSAFLSPTQPRDVASLSRIAFGDNYDKVGTSPKPSTPTADEEVQLVVGASPQYLDATLPPSAIHHDAIQQALPPAHNPSPRNSSRNSSMRSVSPMPDAADNENSWDRGGAITPPLLPKGFSPIEGTPVHDRSPRGLGTASNRSSPAPHSGNNTVHVGTPLPPSPLSTPKRHDGPLNAFPGLSSPHRSHRSQGARASTETFSIKRPVAITSVDGEKFVTNVWKRTLEIAEEEKQDRLDLYKLLALNIQTLQRNRSEVRMCLAPLQKLVYAVYSMKSDFTELKASDVRLSRSASSLSRQLTKTSSMASTGTQLGVPSGRGPSPRQVVPQQPTATTTSLRLPRRVLKSPSPRPPTPNKNTHTQKPVSPLRRNRSLPSPISQQLPRQPLRGRRTPSPTTQTSARVPQLVRRQEPVAATSPERQRSVPREVPTLSLPQGLDPRWVSEPVVPEDVTLDLPTIERYSDVILEMLSESVPAFVGDFLEHRIPVNTVQLAHLRKELEDLAFEDGGSHLTPVEYYCRGLFQRSVSRSASPVYEVWNS
eukprot:PhM_4_TR18723/c0_g1_i1/m.11755